MRPDPARIGGKGLQDFVGWSPALELALIQRTADGPASAFSNVGVDHGGLNLFVAE